MRAFVATLLHSTQRAIRAPRHLVYISLVLGVSIGGNAAVYSLLKAVVLTSDRFEESDRLVRILRLRDEESTGVSISHTEFLDWQAGNSTFSGLAGLASQLGVDVRAQGNVARFQLVSVTDNLFDVLRVRPVVGRTFTVADAQPGADRVAVVSQTVARRLFVTPAAAIGHHVRVHQPTAMRDYVVIGVVDDDARLYWRDRYDVYIPAVARPASTVETARFAVEYEVVGRMRPGVTFEQSATHMNELVRQIALRHPVLPAVGARVERVHDVEGHVTSGTIERLVWVGAVINLVTCLSVAGLLTTLGLSRTREFAIRLACGASRGRIRVQVLAESLVMGMGGALTGVLVTVAAVPALVRLMPPELPRLDHVRVDSEVLAYACALALLTTVVIGLLTGVAILRDVSGPVRTRRRGRPTWAEWFLGAEAALILAVLLPAGLSLASHWRLLHVPLGFNPDGVVAANLLIRHVQGNPEQFAVLERRLLTEIDALPEVQSVALADHLPLRDADMAFSVGVRLGTADAPVRRTNYRQVTPGYFSLMGIPILTGRGLGAGGPTCEVVVNEPFADTYLQGALGTPVILGGQSCEVIGVARTAREDRLDVETPPLMYRTFQYDRLPGSLWVVAKVRGAPARASSAILDAIGRIDRQLSVEMLSLDERVANVTRASRSQAVILAVCGMFALMLSVLSVFAISHESARQRRREIGIRMAVGAQPWQASWALVRRTGLVVALGSVMGLAVGLWIGRTVEHLLFDVRAHDPIAAVGAMGALWLAVTLAFYGPARRAARINPAEVLRDD